MFEHDESRLSGGVHPVLSVLSAAESVFDKSLDVDAASIHDDELPDVLARAHGLAARQVEFFVRILAEADGRDLGRRLGASSTAAWLRDILNLRPGTAKSMVDLAHRLTPPEAADDYNVNLRSTGRGRSMPATRNGMLQGEISLDHAQVISKTMRQLPPDLGDDDAARAEEDLAAFAREHDPATLQKLADHLLHVLSCESLEDREERAQRKRRLRFADLGDGTVRVSGLLGAEDAAIVRTALDPL
ncbi:DUF222 domain-containing protein, partial [Phytoactinopolyspora alkaliphila]